MSDSRNIFILPKSMVKTEKDYFMKLNREASELELYKRTTAEQLHEYFSLREDFDLSDYAIYEKDKIFPCIFGGESTPTPFGVFNIIEKSSERYISPYYPERDYVKFFGYLVIFEDYFIHSDIYEIDAPENTESVPISGKDTTTAGCIRVSSEDLDWLLNHIEIGTVIAL